MRSDQVYDTLTGLRTGLQLIFAFKSDKTLRDLKTRAKISLQSCRYERTPIDID